MISQIVKTKACKF